MKSPSDYLQDQRQERAKQTSHVPLGADIWGLGLSRTSMSVGTDMGLAESNNLKEMKNKGT